MERKRFFLISMLALGMIFILCQQVLAQKVTTLKLSHGYPITHTRNIVAQKMAELAQKYSQGSIKIEIYPAAQLYGAKEELDALIMGSVDITLTPSGMVTRYSPSVKIYDPPGLFPTVEAMMRFESNPEGGLKIYSALETRGMKVLFHMHPGSGLLYSRKPVIKVEDWAGLKIRTPVGIVYEDAVKLLGASGIQMGAAELTTALQQGMVDAVYSAMDTSLGTKWHEIIKYGTIFPYQWQAFALGNVNRWNSLEPEVKKIMDTQVIPETAAFAHKLDEEQSAKALTVYKQAGMTIYDQSKGEELKKFIEKIKPLYKTLEKEVGKEYFDLALKLASQ
jgi:TRAP-type C4-dicarboxylate transport system substrate-binding protein